MQLVIATGQIATVADVRHGYTRGKASTKIASDGGAQVRRCLWVGNPDLEAIDIRRVRGMAEGTTTWLAPVFDIDTEDHIRVFVAGPQGHFAHTGDGNGIGVGSPWLRAADPIIGVAEAGVGQRRQAVASQARTAQAVEDTC